MGKKRRVMAFCAILLTGVLIVWTLWANTALELNAYTVSGDRLPAAFDGYRIAHISDLHSAEIGENNETLLAMLGDAKPNLIAITGDLVDSYHGNMETALEFVAEAVNIAPCYYVSGNHEARLSGYSQLKQKLTSLGVTVLEDARLEVTRGGESISLLGVRDPSFETDYLFGDAAEVMGQKLKDLANGETYTILLSHRPELFDVYVANGIDLVLSGHAHGGQFRLPFLGGLVAPNQGLFPAYDGGLYMEGRTHMLVSRGIGNSIIPLRFNNRPEIILVELRAVS